jgi:S-adenosylmethionine synthetase
VTGISAEAGDDGEVGRGNRINGLITPFRPMTMEAVAGKNAVTHVGKLYNIAASLIAHRLVDEVESVAEAECALLSQIGQRIDEPSVIEVAIRTPPEFGPAQLQKKIEAIVESELSHLRTMSQDLLDGAICIGRWPLTHSSPSLSHGDRHDHGGIGDRR